MSIKHLYEDERPTLLLDFANTKTLDPRIAFERQSVGTYVDETGIIKTAADNEARFDHNPLTGECLGLLIEEGRENLIPESTNLNNTTHWHTSTNPGSLNQSNNAGWMVATANTTEVVSPDGTNNACKLSGLTTSTFDKNWKVHVVPNSNSVPMNANVIYTFTLFVKDPDSVFNGDNKLTFMYGSRYSNTNARVRFDLSNDTVTYAGDIANESASITPYPNGWKKLTATFTNTSSGGGPRYMLEEMSPKTTVNGAAVTQFSINGEKFYVWGFQIEEGYFGTSYMPTSGSTYQRLEDEAEITGTDFSNWHNQSEGTLVVNYQFKSRVQQNSPCSFRTSGSSSGASWGHYTYNGGSQQRVPLVGQIGSNFFYLIGTFNSINTNQFYKVSMAYDQSSQSGCITGDTTKTGTLSAALPTMDRFVIGWMANPTNKRMSGHIASISYYPTRLSDTTLEALTK